MVRNTRRTLNPTTQSRITMQVASRTTRADDCTYAIVVVRTRPHACASKIHSPDRTNAAGVGALSRSMLRTQRIRSSM
jgi:membrane carboxypeptidase/penicillin-binding protein PbpC